MSKRLFISYSHADRRLLERLHKHLAQLIREQSISGWYDREIRAGGRIDEEISEELSKSEIFLACLSPDFIASNYCYEIELAEALKREKAGNLIVVPVILEPCDWLSTPLQKYKAVPEDGKAISEYSNENIALMGVVSELRRVLSISSKLSASLSDIESSTDDRSISRYRIRREYDLLDKRDFVNRAFTEIRSFFESSVMEINSIAEIEAEIILRSDELFSCTIVNRGMNRSFETIHVRRGGQFSDIDIVYGERVSNNSSNGGFSVETDDYKMYFSSHLFHSSGRRKNLSPSEVAKLIWDDLLSKVGIDYD